MLPCELASRQLVKCEAEVLRYNLCHYWVTLATTPVVMLLICNFVWSLTNNNSNTLRVCLDLDAFEHTQLLEKCNSVHTVRAISLNTSTGMYWITRSFRSKECSGFIFLKNVHKQKASLTDHSMLKSEDPLSQVDWNQPAQMSYQY